MERIQLDYKSWQWATLMILSILWGSSFILMKKGLGSYDHTQVAAFRIFFSFLFLLPFTIKNLKVITRENIRSLVIVGIIGFALPALLFTWAQTYISSSLAGMLNSMTPLFTLIVGVSLYRSSTKFLNILGVIIGLAGALGLVWKADHNILDSINPYAILILAATICYGINVNEIKYKLADMSSMEITSLAFFFTGPLAGIYLLFSDFSPAMQTMDYMINLGYIAILALFSSVIAVIIFNHLIKHTTALFASSVTYIIPFFAIFWGVLDGESLSIIQLLWMFIILLGVYLVNK